MPQRGDCPIRYFQRLSLWSPLQPVAQPPRLRSLRVPDSVCDWVAWSCRRLFGGRAMFLSRHHGPEPANGNDAGSGSCHPPPRELSRTRSLRVHPVIGGRTTTASSTQRRRGRRECKGNDKAGRNPSGISLPPLKSGCTRSLPPTGRSCTVWLACRYNVGCCDQGDDGPFWHLD